MTIYTYIPIYLCFKKIKIKYFKMIKFKTICMIYTFYKLFKYLKKNIVFFSRKIQKQLRELKFLLCDNYHLSH